MRIYRGPATKNLFEFQTTDYSRINKEYKLVHELDLSDTEPWISEKKIRIRINKERYSQREAYAYILLEEKDVEALFQGLTERRSKMLDFAKQKIVEIETELQSSDSVDKDKLKEIIKSFFEHSFDLSEKSRTSI